MLDHPGNPRSPSPWYASTRADTYGEGWANFVNAAFLWDEPLTVAADETLALRYRVIVHDGRWALDRIGPSASAGLVISDSHDSVTASSSFTTDTSGVLGGRPLPRLADARDLRGSSRRRRRARRLLSTLTHLAAGGVTTIAGAARRDRDREASSRRRRRARPTRSSPTGSPRRCCAPDRSPATRCSTTATTTSGHQVELRAVDSRDWIELLDADVLPRNYAAVLSRCEQARHELGLVDDTAVLDGLVDAPARAARREPEGLPRRLQRPVRSLRHLHRRPLALLRAAAPAHRSRRGEDGVRNALALVDTVVGPDGAAIPWGRSTGVLAGRAHRGAGRARARSRRPARRPRASAGSAAASRRSAPRGAPLRRRTACATRTGAATRTGTAARPPAAAHARRARQAARGRAPHCSPAGTPTPVASPADASARPTSSSASRPTATPAVWAAANPGRRAVVPFVGVTRSHYLPVPHAPGTFEAPVDNDQVVWAPLVISKGRRATTGELPTRRSSPRRRSVTATWDSLAVGGRGLDGDAWPAVGGSCTTTYTLDRRTIVVEHDLTVTDPVEAIGMQVPETAARAARRRVRGRHPARDHPHRRARHPGVVLAVLGARDGPPGRRGPGPTRAHRGPRDPAPARGLDRVRALVRPAALHADRGPGARSCRRRSASRRTPGRRSTTWSCSTSTGPSGSASTTPPRTSNSSRPSRTTASRSCGPRTTSRRTRSAPTCTTRSTSGGPTPPTR